MIPPKILVPLLFAALGLRAQIQVKGKLLEDDSISALPFAYVINKTNGNGTISDHEGRFSIHVAETDTIVFSYSGYSTLKLAAKDIKKDEKGQATVIMKKLLIPMAPITVSTFRIKPYEREYMQKIIDDSYMRKLDYFSSPFTAMYMQFSREGKQLRKLAQIFEQIFVEEEVQKKLSPEILRKLTNDENIDYAAFRKYCVSASDQYIISHEGAELYNRVMDCYKRWKSEGR